MGRFVLILIAAVGLGGVAVGLSAGDRAHTESQQRAIVRETLDDAVAMVLDKAIHPTRREWNSQSPFSDPFDVNGYEIELEDYHLEDDGQIASFTILARVGGSVVRQTSQYQLKDPGWPGPLWFNTPVAHAQVNPNARIDGSTRVDTRGPVFDASRFNAYRLSSVLNLNQMSGALDDSLHRARGTLGPMVVHSGSRALLDQYDSPSPDEVVGKALSEFDPSTDVRFNGPTVISDERTYGAFSVSGATKIVHVKGNLTISSTGDVTGGGILIVDGNFVVNGKLRWGGLVVVRSLDQALTVDLESGDVRINGGIMVDHEAPPPGGHTDMTIYRDVSGAWSPLYGRVGSGTPGHNRYVDAWKFYDHHHRIDHQVPEQRTFYFAERGRDRHETYTWFRRALTDIATRYPGEDVYVRFRNHSNHGAATFHLVAGGESHDGAVTNGFGSAARAGDSWASPSFRPSTLDTLIVDVRSLRMLAHLTNGEVPTSPYWTNPRQTCPSRAQCIGDLADRDGAMAVQIVRGINDAVLYEAAIYWHTHAPGASSGEYEREQAADDAWRRSIQNGTANYGTTLKLGANARINFENGQVARILNRLGFNQLVLVHVGSFVEDLTNPSSTIPSGPSPSPTPSPTPGPTSTPRVVMVCHNGTTTAIPATALAAHLAHGDMIGMCR